MPASGPGIHQRLAERSQDEAVSIRRKPSSPSSLLRVSVKSGSAPVIFRPIVPRRLSLEQARACLSRSHKSALSKRDGHLPITSQEASQMADGKTCLSFSMTTAKASEFWRNVLAELDQELLPAESGPSVRRENFFTELSLALTAKGLRHKLQKRRGAYLLMVPVVTEQLAVNELNDYLAELSQDTVPNEQSPAKRNAQAPLILLLCLTVLHGLRMGWWAEWLNGKLPPWLAPDDPLRWLKAGAADSFLIIQHQEWYRAVSALGLHSDSQHLFSNIFFGGVFLVPLFRRVGSGPGLLLTTFGGALANLLNSLLQGPSHLSVGFSGAVFAAAGVLSGMLIFENLSHYLARNFSHGHSSFSGLGTELGTGLGTGLGKSFVSLGAALALLGMLGSSGEHTDIGGHLCGLFSGIILGCVYAAFKERLEAHRFWPALSLAQALSLWLWAWIKVWTWS